MITSSSDLKRCVNPVGQCETGKTSLAPRLDSLHGKSIGLIDSIKPNAGLFLSCVEEMIHSNYVGVQTLTVRKNFTASKLIANELEGKVQAMVNAWGD